MNQLGPFWPPELPLKVALRSHATEIEPNPNKIGNCRSSYLRREKGDKYAAASHLITRVFYRPLGHTSPVRPSGVSRPGASGIWRGQSAGFGGGGGIGSPPIFMGAKVKLVAYGVHLLIKYLLTKGNT